MTKISLAGLLLCASCTFPVTEFKKPIPNMPVGIIISDHNTKDQSSMLQKGRKYLAEIVGEKNVYVLDNPHEAHYCVRDGSATNANIKAIFEATLTASKYNIYVTSHGLNGQFCTVDGMMTSKDFKQIIENTGIPALIVMESCYCGGICNTPPKNSIIISSCSSNEVSYFNGSQSFGVLFWKNYAKGLSIEESFRNACGENVSVLNKSMHPTITK